jgi:hypothetical protein
VAPVVAPVVKQLEAPAGWDELEEIYPTDLTPDTVPDRQDLAEVLGLRRAG